MGASQSLPARRRERTSTSARSSNPPSRRSPGPNLESQAVQNDHRESARPRDATPTAEHALPVPLTNGDQSARNRRRPRSLQVTPREEPTPRRVHLARRISSLITRNRDHDYDDSATAKRERSASSSVHHQSPGRPVPKRRRVGMNGPDEELEELDGGERSALDLDFAAPAPSSSSTASPHTTSFASASSSLMASGRSTPHSTMGASSTSGPSRSCPVHARHPYPYAEVSPRSPGASPGPSTPLPVPIDGASSSSAPGAGRPASTSPTEELLADRLRSISTIRDALGPDWTPASSSASLAPSSGGGLFSRFRRTSQRGMAGSSSERESVRGAPADRFTRPPTPGIPAGSAATMSAAQSVPAGPTPPPPRERESRGLGHRLSAIMGFASSRSDEWEEPSPPNNTASTTFGPNAPIQPEDAPASSGEDPARIPVGAVLVIQGLAQTHANLEEAVDPNGIMPGSRRQRLSEPSMGAPRHRLSSAGRPSAATRNARSNAPSRPRIDVASLDQQARMIGNLLTVAAAATATTLLSPTSLAPQQSRTTAHSAMQTILERFRPQRSRANPSIESALGEYLRTVLRDNRRFAEAVAGDATSGNIPSEFQDFLQTLQQDLILAVRAYAVPEDDDDSETESLASEAGGTSGSARSTGWMSVDEDPEDDATHDTARSSNAESASTSSPTSAVDSDSQPIPTFHNQRGQNLPNSASRLGVSGGSDGVPRHLNFFRAHLFPSVSSGGERAADDDANAMVPSIFVGVRSVTHDPNMTTEDLVGHPGFPFLDGHVPDAEAAAAGTTTTISEDEPAFDRDLERELGSPPATTSTLSPVGPGGSSSSRRTLRDRVLERFIPRRETRPHAPQNTYLIYVIGGNYPRSHPVLAIPSLISGGPLTAEDLALVSELLGPAKPPTASEEEINRSGLAVVAGCDLVDLHARGEVLEASLGRCMVCLSDYEAEDECRVLKCRHAFHKECVDHWLSQGRNSCPACRTEAVDKTALSGATETTDADAATSAPAATVPHGDVF